MTSGSDGKVIDHEFAFFGPLGYDLGLFLAGYAFPYAVALAGSHGGKMDAIASAMGACVGTYFDVLAPKLAGGSETTRASIWKDALGFMGCEMLRRVLGVAKRAELEALAGGEQAGTKLAAERIVLNVGELVLLSSDAPQLHGAIAGVTELLARMAAAEHVSD